MSGQLVGEVLAAASQLRARGLSERGFHALVVIAERARADTRQASVRWDHIRDGLYCASLSTAKRAVADLKSAGLIRVVKRGFDNQNGTVRAPIYEIRYPVSKQRVTHSPPTEWVTQVTHSPPTEQLTQVTHSPPTERVTQVTHSVVDNLCKTGGRTGQIGDRTGHPGDLLDGSIDGTTGGGRPIVDRPARDSTGRATPPAKQTSEYHLGPFGPRCRKHIDDPTPPGCWGCKTAKDEFERTSDMANQHDRERLAAHRREIDACGRCDRSGLRLSPDGADLDEPRRCDHGPFTVAELGQPS